MAAGVMNDPLPDARPIRALHVINNLDIGGAQEVVRSLAPALRAKGVDVAVATLRDGPLREPLEQAGIPVTVVGGRTRSLVSDPRAAAEVWQLHRGLASAVDHHRSTVVQTHLLRSLDFLALFLRRRPSRPAVAWTVHNARLDLRADQLPGRRWLLGPKRQAYRTLYRHGSRIAHFVAVSDDVAGAIRTAVRPASGHLHTIPNGVDVHRYGGGDRDAVRRELTVPDDAAVVICVAKMLEQKGHRMLIDALAAPEVADLPLHVLLVGEGPLRNEIEERARRAGVGDRLRFLGNRPDVPRLLAAADIFVLPSRWEGLPMALLEAMAAGLPSVATAVSGTRQVVTDGENGLLVPPEHPGAIAEAVSRLARNPELRAALGAAARQRVVAAFSVERQAMRHVELYRLITGAAGSPAREEGT
jgi:glycosyltransferase involved in cell wall biosynthesis